MMNMIRHLRQEHPAQLSQYTAETQADTEPTDEFLSDMIF